MKKTIIITSLAVTFLSVFGPSCYAQQSETTQELYAKGQVNEVTEQKIEIQPDNPLYDPTKEQSQFHTIQNVTFEVLEGEYKGTIFESTNEITGQIYDIYLEKGDTVMLFLNVDGEQIEGYATDFIRNNTMIVFVALFFLGLILLGKMKGLKALISLIVTIGAIFFILIPLTIQGYDALLIATCVSIAISLITITLIAGINKKALSAIIGTVFGVLCAALIAYFVGNISLLTGLSGEDARILYINRPELNFSHIFFASIMIGALGAVMDVGMSIASSVNEIYLANKSISGKKLFEAGMQVGKDIMGTMSNTLILAYVGSSFPLLLLFAMDNFDFMHVINFDFIAAEIVRSISGSFGLLLAIPVTALASSLLIRKRT
ncbi:YibE/F family protein [Candidatus Peregrinibacteria bacterium]|nr:YibE/F family protein [Candidatus Peregrinibacteria bacterium]